MRYALLTCAVLVVLLLLWRQNSPSTAPVPVTENRPAELTAQKSVTTPASLPAMHRAAPLATSTLDETKARAAALMLQWAQAARPHNFDPVIKGYQVHTNREGEVKLLGISTRTHFLTMARRSDGEMIQSATASFDSERTPPEYKTNWHKLTGKWTEQEAIAETRAILQRLGAKGTLASATVATYEAPALPVAGPDGKPVERTPFAHVTLHSTNGNRLVQAQYRLEANGPGLVRWWHWPAGDGVLALNE